MEKTSVYPSAKLAGGFVVFRDLVQDLCGK